MEVSRQNRLAKFDIDRKTKHSISKYLTLKDIDLKVKKGEFVCIIGEIGSGKTSILQSIIGDLVFVPKEDIKQLGEAKHAPEEFTALRSKILHKDFKVEDPPIKLTGKLSYVEQ